MGAGLETVLGCASVVCWVEEGRFAVGRSLQGGKGFGSLVAVLGCAAMRWQCLAAAMQTRVGRGTCRVMLFGRGRALRRHLEVAMA